MNSSDDGVRYNQTSVASILILISESLIVKPLNSITRLANDLMTSFLKAPATFTMKFPVGSRGRVFAVLSLYLRRIGMYLHCSLYSVRYISEDFGLFGSPIHN